MAMFFAPNWIINRDRVSETALPPPPSPPPSSPVSFDDYDETVGSNDHSNSNSSTHSLVSGDHHHSSSWLYFKHQQVESVESILKGVRNVLLKEMRSILVKRIGHKAPLIEEVLGRLQADEDSFEEMNTFPAMPIRGEAELLMAVPTGPVDVDILEDKDEDIVVDNDNDNDNVSSNGSFSDEGGEEDDDDDSIGAYLTDDSNEKEEVMDEEMVSSPRPVQPALLMPPLPPCLPLRFNSSATCPISGTQQQSEMTLMPLLDNNKNRSDISETVFKRPKTPPLRPPKLVKSVAIQSSSRSTFRPIATQPTTFEAATKRSSPYYQALVSMLPPAKQMKITSGQNPDNATRSPAVPAALVDKGAGSNNSNQPIKILKRLAYYCLLVNCRFQGTCYSSQAAYELHRITEHQLADKVCPVPGCTATLQTNPQLIFHISQVHGDTLRQLVCTQCPLPMIFQVDFSSSSDENAGTSLQAFLFHRQFAHERGIFQCAHPGCAFQDEFRDLVVRHYHCNHQNVVKMLGKK